MSVKPFILLALSVVVAQSATGQQRAADTVLKGSTIEVIQSYKPQVRKAPKPEWLPQLPPADTSRPVLNYDVPQQTLYYSYTSGQLRPLALGKDSLVIPFPNYIKAGGGNLSTLFLDAGIASIRGKNYETGIHLHHLSQKGNINSQQSSLSGLEADGVLHTTNNEWHASANIERNQYYFYGIDPTLIVLPITEDKKQTFTTVRVSADMKNRVQDPVSKINYHPSVTASIYDARFNNSRFNNSETNFGFNAPFSYGIDSTLNLSLALSTSFTQLKMSSNNISNNIAALTPGITLNKGALQGKAFLGFAVGKGGILYILPELTASYQIPSTALRLSGGWQANVRQNTYEQLTSENPYLLYDYHTLFSGKDVKQSRRDELFASVSGTQGSHFNYLVKVSWWNFTNLATYLDTSAFNQRFNVIYDDVSAISLHGAVRYTQSSKWSAGVTGDFYKFYQGTQQYAWHQPTLNIKGDFSIRPIKDLTVSAYITVLGGIYALDNANKAIMLTPITDIGGNAEYNLGNRMSVFLQVSNLLNSKYQRWSYYQSYGLNVYGGLRLKF